MVVVNKRSHKPTSHDVYIGRPSVFGNPVRLNKEHERSRVVALFEDWIRNDPSFMAQRARDAIRELPEDAVLVCWCAPKQCHGDVIIKLWKEYHNA